MESQKLSIELTVAELNGVLGALGQRPFIEVAGLIQKIQSQAAAQLSEREPSGLEES